MDRKVLGLAFSLMLVVASSGCGGGGAKNYNISKSTTIGQELKDLKDAYDKGAISQSEYEETKEKILKAPDEG